MQSVTASVRVLVIPLSLMLFIQWPLRDWIHAYSTTVNDLGQILFAVYASVAITAASVSNSHLAIAKQEDHAVEGKLRWRSWSLLLCLAPWALFLIYTAVPQMFVSVAHLESFSEGLTPGYFVLRIALVLLAALVLLEAVSRVFASFRQR